MHNKKMGKRNTDIKNIKKQARTYPRPSWVPNTVSGEEELCPECFKVVGERSRYKLVCMLGKVSNGMTVTELTERLKLKQPTVTHHLQVLRSVHAVGLVISFVAAGIFILWINRKFHSWKIPAAFSAILVGISFFLFMPYAFPERL